LSIAKREAADSLIIESYKASMEAIASYLGEAYEIVLHDLQDLDHSIIKIINGFHSGRTQGSPITDFALSMLEQIDGGASVFRVYHSKSKYGKPVKSATIAINGQSGKPIAMLCINLYLDSPIHSFLQSFFAGDNAEYANENFIRSSDELIRAALDEAKSKINADKTIPASLKNKAIVNHLCLGGIFKLKSAIKIAADDLGISTNTVYLHIRAMKQQEKDAP
jgi:predicted transcriptional regulator YheO